MSHARLVLRAVAALVLLGYIGLGVAKIAGQSGLSRTLRVTDQSGSACYLPEGTTAEQALQAGGPCQSASDHTAYWWPGWIVTDTSSRPIAVSRYVPADLAAVAVLLALLGWPRRQEAIHRAAIMFKRG
jgi:hypothetical protein